MNPFLRPALLIVLLTTTALSQPLAPTPAPAADASPPKSRDSGTKEEAPPTQAPTPKPPPLQAEKGRIENFPADSPERLELLKVQILLDQAMFRPGKLDGLPGEFTQKAADRYLASRGLPPGRVDTSPITKPLTEYTVTEEDMKFIGRLASNPAAQARLSSMPYGDVWELVAEKFHCDLNYLKQLNPDLEGTSIDTGTTFRVPNLEPFAMQDVLALNEQRKAEAKARKERTEAEAERAHAEAEPASALEESSPAGTTTATPSPGPDPTPTATPEANPIRLVLLREPRLIEVYRGEEMIGCFPCTPGSSRVPVPKGTWKITSNIMMPYFRYDKSVLRDGTRSSNAFNIPPGPNNYVGIVWMGINRRSVGIHGTNSPDRIGRNQSSGCIRLANWDAWEMTQLVEKGTPVEVR